MKYPDNTISRPVKGREAELLIRAIESGQSVTTDAGRATIARILERRRGTANGKPGKVR